MAALAVTAGCAVGPDYETPAFLPATDWSQAGNASVAADTPLSAAWWQAFDDAALDELVVRALENNRDLAAAIARVDEARAGSAAARGERLPALALDARYTWFEQSLESPQTAGPLIAAGVIPRDGEFYTGTLEASWELDLAGGIRRAIEAADAAALAQLAAADGVAVQVVAETVAAYVDWQGFTARADIARRNAALQASTLEIIRGKVRLGLTRRLDETRAVAELARLEATVPGLEAAAEGARQRLAVLTGATGAALPAAASGEVPAAPAAIPVGTPAELLRRRPDVRAAERQLARAVADQGVATAAFFPALTLTARGGFEAARTGDLGAGDARTIGIVPFVRWPVFQGGRLRAALAAADARQAAALAEYEQSVLGALADTETALAGLSGSGRSLAELERAVAASRESEQLANRLYRQGLTDFLTLLDAQRQLALTEDALQAAAVSHSLNAVRLYRSLGGAWPEFR